MNNKEILERLSDKNESSKPSIASNPVSDSISDRDNNRNISRDDVLRKASNILADHGMTESNISVNNEYWDLMNLYRSMGRSLKK